MENSTDNLNPALQLEEKKLDFEKYKIKVELFKWLIGSVALVLITTIIDFSFKDRTAGLAEMLQYDKYVTELIVLNKDPGQKRMLAQFFSNVTASEKLKDGWQDYFKEIDKEYKAYIAPVLKNDSIIKGKYYLLLNRDSLSDEQKKEKQFYELQIEENKKVLNPEIILPGSISKDYKIALDWEIKGFNFLLNKDVQNAITAFRNSEEAYNSFHQVYEIANYLSKHETKLKDKNSAYWDTALKTIGREYSWKMPLEIKKKLLE